MQDVYEARAVRAKCFHSGHNFTEISQMALPLLSVTGAQLATPGARPHTASPGGGRWPAPMRALDRLERFHFNGILSRFCLWQFKRRAGLSDVSTNVENALKRNVGVLLPRVFQGLAAQHGERLANAPPGVVGHDDVVDKTPVAGDEVILLPI